MNRATPVRDQSEDREQLRYIVIGYESEHGTRYGALNTVTGEVLFLSFLAAESAAMACDRLNSAAAAPTY
jgi:hypothetical protein